MLISIYSKEKKRKKEKSAFLHTLRVLWRITELKNKVFEVGYQKKKVCIKKYLHSVSFQKSAYLMVILFNMVSLETLKNE